MSFKKLSQKQKYKYVERTAAGGNGGPFIQYLKGCSTSTGHELSRCSFFLFLHCSPPREVVWSPHLVKEQLSSYLVMHFHFRQTFAGAKTGAPALQGVYHTHQLKAHSRTLFSGLSLVIFKCSMWSGPLLLIQVYSHPRQTLCFQSVR